MNETLSTRQLRLVGLLLVIVVCAGGYWTVMKGHNSSSPSTAKSSTVSSTPSSTTPSTQAPSKTHTHTATPTKPATHVATGGLPVAVTRALHKHSVVVVSLAAPGAGVDQLAAAEAQAGAVAAKAGFVKVDVYNQQPGIAILRKLGVMDTPALLVVKRPYLVYSHFQGFVDRNVVEQSVADARG
jgi:cytoskeletal protein RodZ